MILSIHQPSYFPWLGLLDKIARSDVHMVMDEVQLSDSAYQHRNLFLTADGKVKFLTIPFVKKDYLKRDFRELEISRDDWITSHRNFIQNTYGRHPYAAEIMPRVEQFFAERFALLADAVYASLRLSLDLFGIRTHVIRQSELAYDRSLRRGELVVALARAAGASCYLSGTGAKAYLDESAFGGDLTLRYNEFHHPQYPQKGSAEFRSGLACLDALFNLGGQGARALLGLS
jgi:WbqC-like protein family